MRSRIINLIVIYPLNNRKHSEIRHLVLVGDEMQLSATVISNASQECGYGRSLLSRLKSLGFPFVMLSEQYRMHPMISAWPRNEFYSGHLIDANAVLNRPDKPWHSNTDASFN